jgi:hypothetical protein
MPEDIPVSVEIQSGSMGKYFKIPYSSFAASMELKTQ